MSTKYKDIIRSLGASKLGRKPVVSASGLVDVDPAIDCSRVTTLSGRPYPVQFRSQGAIDAWARALEGTESWRRWQYPGLLCWDIRQEISWQLGHMYPISLVPKEKVASVSANRQMLAVEVSANLKYHLNQGTVIEPTAALETLLTHSDVDLELPMSAVAAPFRAQYLRFGVTAMQHLKMPEAQAPNHVFDGVFCFFTPESMRRADGEGLWTLELIFMTKRQDSHKGHGRL